MTTLERLARWKEAGAISELQYDAISAIVCKERFSVFFELNALLYLGVLSFVAGVGWVIQRYLQTLGDAAIIGGLAAILIASFYYCFSHAGPYSAAQVESPTLAFDYILYLACLTFGLEIGFVESRFKLLQSEWDFYLLLSTGLFSYLAYRFDNRLVLSLALSTLAGWFGIRFSRIGPFSPASFRPSALIYGAIVVAAGIWLYRYNIKRHFTATYFHVASLVVFSALLSGVFEENGWPFFIGLLCLSGVAIAGGIHFRAFAFVVYGVAFGYIAISAELLRNVSFDSETTLGYFAVSATMVIVILVVMARRFGREE